MSTPIDNEKYAPSGKRVQLPSIPSVNAGTLLSAVSKIKETIDVREGRVGSKYEQYVTWRDLVEIGLVATSSGGAWNVMNPTGVVRGTTLLASIPSVKDQLEIEIRNSRAYKTLFARINSPEALAGLPDEVRAVFERDLLEEAKQRQAAIRELELIIQNERKSFAMKTTELTAAVDGAQAGVRQVSYASAEQNKATAGLVTQVSARLDNFGGGGVTVEQSMTATVDRLDGMSGVYSVKINAGGKFAGFQLSVDAPVGTTPYSAFLVDADKFAIFTSGGNFSPFGVDASGVYMNGTVRINVGGMTLSQLADNAAVPSTTFIGSFSTVPSGNKNEIYKNTTDGKTYIHTGTAWTLFVENGANGTNGVNGTNGAAGARGSQTFYATGTPWALADAEAATGGANDTANSTVTAITGSATRIIGDTVTITNAGGTATGTRYWSGTAWVKPGVRIDGNLLVTGTISADKINGGDFTGKSFTGGSFAGATIYGSNVAATVLSVAGDVDFRSVGIAPVFSIVGTTGAATFGNANSLTINSTSLIINSTLAGTTGVKIIQKGVSYAATVDGVAKTIVFT